MTTDDDRLHLEAIQRRKDAGEDKCDSCSGSGAAGPRLVCSDCLGQGILLTAEEYKTVLRVSGREATDFDDGILFARVVS